MAVRVILLRHRVVGLLDLGVVRGDGDPEEIVERRLAERGVLLDDVFANRDFLQGRSRGLCRRLDLRTSRLDHGRGDLQPGRRWGRRRRGGRGLVGGRRRSAARGHRSSRGRRGCRDRGILLERGGTSLGLDHPRGDQTVDAAECLLLAEGRDRENVRNRAQAVDAREDEVLGLRERAHLLVEQKRILRGLENAARIAERAAHHPHVVQPPGTFEDDVGGGKVQNDVLVHRALVLLESVLAPRPAEEGVDDGLDLLHHLAFHLLRGGESELHQRPPEAVAFLPHYPGGTLESRAVDELLADEELAEPVGLDVGIREDHRALAEIDPLARFFLGKVQDPALPVDVQFSDYVTECVAGEIALQFRMLREETAAARRIRK